jgi:hypothetical protein
MGTSEVEAKPRKKRVPVEIARVGKDEMNLAEFPITILTNRAPEGVKTLRYRDHRGQLTVTGSDALGLPTAIDADVIVALIELTKNRNNFTEQTVHFTRYELIRLIGWANVGTSYERVEASLNRWAGVLLMYDGCWWDNRSKTYVSKTFHIIESIVIAEGKLKATRGGERASLPSSSFTWSKDFIQSCKDNNLKDLDTSLYFSLTLPTSKQLFRFLDKRFYRRPDLDFDLAEVAFERVGLSRGYSGNAGKIKEKLGDAVGELETRGFLKPLARDERYFKTQAGWRIRLIDGRGTLPALAGPPPSAPPEAAEASPPPLVDELVKRGVKPGVAADLAGRHPAAYVAGKIEQFDWEMTRARPPKKPAGYLVKSIVDGYDADPDFVPKAERDRRADAAKQQYQTEAAACRHKQEEDARERAEKEAVDAYWESLTPGQQAELDDAAEAGADPEQLALERSMGGAFQRMGRQLRRGEHIRQLLRDRRHRADGA